KLVTGVQTCALPIYRVVEIKKTAKCADAHPNSVFVDARGPKWEVLADSLFSLGEWVSNNSIDVSGRYRAGRDLLLRNPPRLRNRSEERRVGKECRAR